MSKYNHSNSIPVDSISKEELPTAIKEWAEGSNSLEKLLWSLYNNGLKTSGSHAGPRPFLDFYYDPNKKDLIIKLMNSVLYAKGSLILISPNGGNPFSGPEWYKPTILLGSDMTNKDVIDKQFEIINKIINNEMEIPIFIDTSHIIDLLEFFMGKEKNFMLRIRHTFEDDIIFSIETKFKNKDSNFEELNSLLTKMGFILEEVPDHYEKFWNLSIKDPTEWMDKTRKIINEIINNYKLVNNSNIEEASSFNEKARIMRNKSLRETGNEEMFNKWLKEERNK